MVSAPAGGASAGRCTGDRFVIRGEKAWLAGRVLVPSGVIVSVEAGIGDHINVKEPLTLRIAAASSSKEVEFVVVFVPLADGESAPEIAPLGGGKSGARIGDERIVFDPDGRRAPHRE